MLRLVKDLDDKLVINLQSKRCGTEAPLGCIAGSCPSFKQDMSLIINKVSMNVNPTEFKDVPQQPGLGQDAPPTVIIHHITPKDVLICQ